MSLIFLLVLAIRPGFGKLSLEHHDVMINGEMTRLSEKVLVYKNNNYGFELRCPETPEQSEMSGNQEDGFVRSEFIQ